MQLLTLMILKKNIKIDIVNFIIDSAFGMMGMHPRKPLKKFLKII